MRTLIRIIFVIFIANRIDCLGGVCDDCCDCLKNKKEDNKKEEIKENEKIGGEGEEEKKEDEKKEDENITAESLVNGIWFDNKKGLILKIFKKKENDNVFTSTENGNEISFKLDENDNPKIDYQDGPENKLNLGGKKYALFEIKTEVGNIFYLYCSDVESSSRNEDNEEVVYGIFDYTKHINISVIACDTTNVTNMACMFYTCNSLKKLNIKNFNTTNITNMAYMFYKCSSLENLEFGDNFNTTNIKDKKNKCAMFKFCKKLPKNIKNKILGENE